jgi:hypothetical protein
MRGTHSLFMIAKNAMPATLRVQLLDEFRLFIDNQPAYILDRPRQQSLLAYLLLHRRALLPL